MVQKKNRKSKPATTPEGRENQLISLAVELAEQQLRDGTASPSIISHYIKMGTTREQLERDILEKQSELIKAKAENINRDRDAEELAKSAIEAMKNYNPNTSGSNENL